MMHTEIQGRMKGLYMILLACGLGLSACGGGGSGSSSGGGAPAADLTLTLPLKNYTIDSDSLKIDSASGIVHASIGPFGAHFSPLTGHTWGDAKGNIVGYFARTDAELTIFTDVNGDGVCGPFSSGDVCGLSGGTNGTDLLAAQPTYIAPVAGTVTWVSQDRPPGADLLYLNAQPHWNIQVQLSDRYTLSIGHIGSIATALHNKILSATGVDTDTYTAGDGVNLLNGVTIDVAQGEELAHPQLVAQELASHPRYFTGDGNNHYPWSQIEYTLIDHTLNTNVCYYDLLSAAEKTSLTNAMIADMQSTTSPRYGGAQQLSIWKWGAEAVLCNAHSPGENGDFSNIHTHLGGWVERASPGVTRDELFSIIPIQTGSPLYNAANYQSGVTHLVARERIGVPDARFYWTMPDGSKPTDIFYPAGEVLEETANSLLIMWRDFSSTYTPPVFQRVAFQLDSDGLKVKWGDFADSKVAAMQPVLGSDACNDTDVICYYHLQDLHK